MNKTSQFCARPSFLSGAARLVDLGGTFDTYPVRRSTLQADAKALAGDWKATGSALRGAFHEFKRGKKLKTR